MFKLDSLYRRTSYIACLCLGLFTIIGCDDDPQPTMSAGGTTGGIEGGDSGGGLGGTQGFQKYLRDKPT